MESAVKNECARFWRSVAGKAFALVFHQNIVPIAGAKAFCLRFEKERKRLLSFGESEEFLIWGKFALAQFMTKKILATDLFAG